MSNQSPLKHLTKCLQSNTKLEGILHHARQLAHIESICHKHLAIEKLAQHCHVANYSNQQLTLIVDSAVYAHQLRFALPTLLEYLRGIPELKGIKEIRYKIDPTWERTKQTQKKRPTLTLSKDNAQLLKNTAAGLTKQPELQEALERLSKNG